MTGYYSNLALHISDATLKAHRRLDHAEPSRWPARLMATGAAVGLVILTWTAVRVIEALAEGRLP